jgi:hypothetical protein
MRELSVAEQRYQAVLAVIADGLSVQQHVRSARRGNAPGASWCLHVARAFDRRETPESRTAAIRDLRPGA